MPIRGRRSRQLIHQRLATEVDELRSRLGDLPRPEEGDGVWTDIWYHEAILREGRAVGNKELKDYR
ncbi:MAG: hypothetical protein ACR2PL_18560 [Dehalococcoidia bacterium]